MDSRKRILELINNFKKGDPTAFETARTQSAFVTKQALPVNETTLFDGIKPEEKFNFIPKEQVAKSTQLI